jgi:alkanesulfonate monooxygenase SsuD/methylene tetrahydromethanopterin reductase-like flavin-dependent oxidoreductase (luciferase family)
VRGRAILQDSALRFGVIATLLPAPELVKVGVAAEKYGYDSVWVPDHFVDLPPSGDRHDPWVILSAIAANTNRITLSTAATDALRYYPPKLAHIIATLDELSGGRAMVGLGSGEAMNVKPFGIEWEKPAARIQRVRETVEVLRLLWASSRSHPASYAGDFYNLDNCWLDTPPVQKPSPPIFVAALTSNSLLSLAGELGDGWLTGYIAPESFEEKVEVVMSAARTAGRSPKELRVAHWFCAALSDDGEVLKKARSAVAPEILLCADSSRLKRHGLELPPEMQAPSRVVYTSLLADASVASSAAEVASRMPDELVDEFVPCGGAAQLIESIDRLRRAGATDIVFRDVVGQIVKHSPGAAIESLREFSTKVIPYFRGA